MDLGSAWQTFHNSEVLEQSPSGRVFVPNPRTAPLRVTRLFTRVDLSLGVPIQPDMEFSPLVRFNEH
jgi:hypothetical protein